MQKTRDFCGLLTNLAQVNIYGKNKKSGTYTYFYHVHTLLTPAKFNNIWLFAMINKNYLQIACNYPTFKFIHNFCLFNFQKFQSRNSPQFLMFLNFNPKTFHNFCLFNFSQFVSNSAYSASSLFLSTSQFSSSKINIHISSVSKFQSKNFLHFFRIPQLQYSRLPI
jgi:hypothetical protein